MSTVSIAGSLHQLFIDNHIAPDWKSVLTHSCAQLPKAYLDKLLTQKDYLPKPHQLFAAFQQPRAKVQIILMGESPYPRADSANGFAFWDASVGNLWSKTGLSTQVNRATSLRHFVKMLLIAEGLLSSTHCSQEAIAKLDKNTLCHTLDELFLNMLDKGFLLLNASLVLDPHTPKTKTAKLFLPFVAAVLHALPHATLLLFGNLAQSLSRYWKGKKMICAEHPYCVSFLQRQPIIDFFSPLHLIRASHV